MNSEEKLKKQQAFLAQYIEYIDLTLKNGILSLKYRKIDCTKEEIDLQKIREVFSSETFPNKKTLKSCIERFEDTTAYLMCLYADDFVNGDPLDFDPIYEDQLEKPSQATIDYQKKVVKAFEAKQKRAPGFDGVGGGCSRGSGKKLNN